METPQSATNVGKDGGVAKESIVLSRIRMLDARLTNGDKASPSAHTRKNVHSFNRAMKSHNSPLSNSRPQRQVTQTQIGPESRDTDASSRPTQNSFRDDTAIVLSQPVPPKNNRLPPTIDTDQNHLAQIRNSSPRGDRGSPLRRDDTVHTIEHKTMMKPGTNASPLLRPDVAMEKNLQSASPGKIARFNPSPAPYRTINKETSPVVPSNSHRSNSVSEMTKKGYVGESPTTKPLHPFNQLQRKMDSSAQTRDVSPLIVATPESSAEKAKKIPYRVAQHFARNPSLSPKKTRIESPLKVAIESEDTKSRALSPAGTRLTLQRHYWDKGTGDSSTDKAPANSSTSSSAAAKKPPFVLEIGVGRTKVRQDPSPRNASMRLTKPEPEPSMVSNKPFQTKIQREYRKIPPSPRRKIQDSETTLERKLNAASVVMYEERVSSVGSTSSSERSGLSQAELGGIAVKALELSKVNTNSKPRNGNTPLQHIISTKRTGNSASKEQMPYSYSSAQRLSERLTRAERFTALKNAKYAGRANGQQSIHNNGPSSPVPSDSYSHPVFGYSKNPIAINTTEASEGEPLLTPEPSCVRRSKHLSKNLQNKANQFAMASPTRRSKGMTTGFDNNPETRREVNHPSNHHRNDHSSNSNDQHRYDPLGLNVANRPHQQPNGNARHDVFSYNAPTGNVQKQSYGVVHQPPQAVYNNQKHFHPNRAPNHDQSKSVPSHDRGLKHTMDRSNHSRPNHPPTTSKPFEQKHALKVLSPGQQLEILAREQRSKFQEEEARYRNFNQKIERMEYDNETVYSEGGVSSVDGEILIEEQAPVAMRQRPVDNFTSAHPVQMNQLDTDYSRQENHLLHGNHQAFTYPSNVGQPSYRHASKRPEPIPMTQPADTPATGCDNTFTGSLNKTYTKSTPATGCDNTFTGSLNRTYKSMTPATGFDNTFTGSLNPNVIVSVNDSSDSSAARPDAFRWLHQKYGNQAPVLPEVTMRNHISPTMVISKHPVANTNIANDEDDDVFFGLDEVNTEDHPELSSKQKSKELAPTPQNDGDSMFLDISVEQDMMENEQGNFSRNNETNISPRNARSSNFEESDHPETNQGTTVVNEGKEQKKRNRPFPIETILEEAHVCISRNKSSDKEETGGDDESEQDENKPPTSVLKNLGSAIVKSIQRACAIPEELPDLGACAMNTKMKCEEKISEAWVGLDEDENVTHGDVSRTSKTTETGVVLNENDIGVATTEHDERSQASESSSNLQSHEKFMERRNEAQSKLHQHAETAMALFGNNNTAVMEFDVADRVVQKPTLSTDSSTTQGPKPLAAEMGPISRIATKSSPTSRVSTGISVDHRMVLQTFSTCLKKGGVEVLKLSRWNIWQVRYLTVSMEATQLKNDDENDAARCPTALLWMKQTGKSKQNRSLSSIKDNGRGGMLFETMKQVVPIESNEYYDRNLPKRLQKKFPLFAGVLMHYALNGSDRHVHFCFKTKQDAQSFITTMRIIQDVGKRTSEIEATPTVSSGKSHDS